MKRVLTDVGIHAEDESLELNLNLKEIRST
jgi:hypothetical protein